MQNIVIDMCGKFRYDRLRNDRALADRKSDNNKNKKLSYCWETVRRESMPRIAKVGVEMTT